MFMFRRSNEAYRTGNIGLSVCLSLKKSNMISDIGQPLSGLFRRLADDVLCGLPTDSYTSGGV